MSVTVSRRQGLYYGWVIIGSLFTVSLVSSGTRFSFGAFYDALLEEFDWTRAMLAGAASLNLVLAGLVRPFIGVLVDRYGSKAVMISGLALAATALMLLSFATELWHFYALFTLMSLGYGASAPATAVPLVSRWFVRRQATAQSVASAGGPTGELVVVPIMTAVLLLTDWHTAYRVLAVVVGLLLLPAAIAIIRNSPAELGLAPDNDADSPAVRRQASLEAVGMTLRQALRTPLFWQLGFGFFVCGFTMTFASTHFMIFAGDEGVEKMTASFAMGMIGGVSILATIAFGYLGDRFSRQKLLSLVYFLRGLAFLVLWLIPHSEHRVETLFLGAFLLGLSWGATTPLTSACVADACGRRYLGSIFSTMFAFMPLGSGLGAYLAALVFDAVGSYAPALFFDFVLGVLAALVVLRTRLTEYALEAEKTTAAPAAPQAVTASPGAAGGD